MGAGGFPIDLLLFGMIAAFLVLRLRSILGRRDGLEPAPGQARPARTAGPVIDAVAEPPAAARKLPEPGTEVAQAIGQMQRVEPGFDPQRFLDGAEGAFRLIVAAFAHGDRDALRPLLSPDTFTVFDTAITEREAAGHVLTSDIRDVHEVEIIAAALQGRAADITVRFVSDQVSSTLDRDGHYVAGTDAVTELRDEWSFTRTLGQADPAWRLTQARSA